MAHRIMSASAALATAGDFVLVLVLAGCGGAGSGMGLRVRNATHAAPGRRRTSPPSAERVRSRWVVLGRVNRGQWESLALRIGASRIERRARLAGLPYTTPYSQWRSAWSPDGKWLALASRLHGACPDVVAFEDSGPGIRVTLAGHCAPGYRVQWAPVGARLLVQPSSTGEPWRIEDFAGRRRTRELMVSGRDATAKWSADGRYLLGCLRVIDTAKDPPSAKSLEVKGRGSERRAQVYSGCPEQGQCPTNACSWSPGAPRLLCNNSAALFDVRDGRATGKLLAPGRTDIKGLTWLGEDWLLVQRREPDMHPYGVMRAEPGATLVPVDIHRTHWVPGSVFSTRGAMLAYASGGRLHLLRVGRVLSDTVVDGPRGDLTVRWTPDGRDLVVQVIRPNRYGKPSGRELWVVRNAGGGARKATLVQRVGPGRELWVHLTPGSRWIRVDILAAFFKTKVAGGEMSAPSRPSLSSAFLWHIATGTRRSLPPRRKLEWAPDDSMFIAKDGKAVRVWRVHGSRIVGGEVLVRMKGDLLSVAWQP